MQINKHKKQIVFTANDTGWRVVLFDKKLDECIILKITFTDKGFGVQAFKQPEGYTNDLDLIAISENKIVDVGDYISVWKLLPEVRRRITKRDYLKTSRYSR